MTKPDLIKNNENIEGTFSVLRCVTELEDFKKFDSNKNLEVIFSESDFENQKIVYKTKLYKSISGFYIYCGKVTVPPFGIPNQKYNIEINIYHKPQQINEINIFLLQLNKK